MKNPIIIKLTKICNDEHDGNYAYENGDHDKYDENDSKKI